MIYDVLSNAQQYAGLNVDVDKVLEAAQSITAENYPEKRIVIDGDNIFVNVPQYATHGTDTAIFEAHRQYIDVFIMVEGTETVYVKNTAKLNNVTKPYDPAIEALLADFDSDAVPVRMEPGHFLILFPQDAHAPGCHADGPSQVKKLIGKVRIR